MRAVHDDRPGHKGNGGRMSTEARHASIPPRPTQPPSTGTPETDREETGHPHAPDAAEGPRSAVTPGPVPAMRPPAVPPLPGTRPTPGAPTQTVPGTATTAGPATPRRDAEARPADTAPDTPPRFPNLRAPSSGATPPPPPPASARFPDTPPPTGREARQTDATPARPPRPSTLLRRNGTPPETASETTFRLRPIPADPDSARNGHRAAAPPDRAPFSSTSDGVPPRPAGRPASAHAGRTTPAGEVAPPGPRPSSAPSGRAGSPGGVPPRPDAHPASALTDPYGHSAARHADADPVPLQPDPTLSWSAPLTPGGTHGSGRPVVSFGQPEGYDEQTRPRPLGGRSGARAVGVAICLVLGLGLIGGAVTGSWLVGDSAAAGARDTFAAAAGMWHSVPVDQLFPPTVQGQGAGPGGADRTWTRIAVAPDSGCKDAFDPLLGKALAPVGCQRLLRATYTDATRSYVTTVGLLFTKADAAGMTAVDTRFTKEGLDRRADLMPRSYAAKDTVAADFGAEQRASWTISVLTDAPVVVYAVSGWADGRTVDEPQSAKKALESGATTAVAQAGLGNEAQGLADRIERGLRKTVSSATEPPS